MQVTYWQPAVPLKIIVIYADFWKKEEQEIVNKNDIEDIYDKEYKVFECTFLGMKSSDSKDECAHAIIVWDPYIHLIKTLDPDDDENLFDKDIDSGYVIYPVSLDAESAANLVNDCKLEIFRRWIKQ